MLSTQDELNKVVDPNWRDRGFRWEDAMMVEAVELFDHLPWKWWKKAPAAVDFEQVKLEAIDIWHFLLSRVLEDHGDEEGLAILAEAFKGHDDDVATERDPALIRSAARYFLADVSTQNVRGRDVMGYLYSFVGLLSDLGITVDELYTTYVAKTELNRLRWANGYGAGYMKIWDGQEDNVWLAAHMATLDVNAPDFKDQVAAGLTLKYNSVVYNANVNVAVAKLAAS